VVKFNGGNNTNYMKNHGDYIIDVLKFHGFEAYYIGGSVRNTIHNEIHNDNLHIKDYDIVTNASYDDVSKIFSKVSDRGAQFQVAVIETNEGFEFEVAQYRTELYDENGSLRPNEVKIAGSLQEDVKRRDFTVNALAMDRNGVVIDYVDGLKDIQNKLIRTVGEPKERFSEDPLRMLRAFRFVSQLGYSIEENTLNGIKENLYKLEIIPHERVKEEFNKILMGKYSSKALRIMKNLEIYNYNFYNSIDKRKVKFMKFFFTQKSFDDIVNEIYLVDDLFEKYIKLYSNIEFDVAKQELLDCLFLSKNDIELLCIVVKNKDFAYNQTLDNAFRLIKSLPSKLSNKSSLNQILYFIENTYNQTIDKNMLLNRICFTNELPFNTESFIKQINKSAGPWVKSALDYAVEKCFYDQFSYEELLEKFY
jgi:tRNA nucleotidyltransferase/poly(A) polymerase